MNLPRIHRRGAIRAAPDGRLIVIAVCGQTGRVLVTTEPGDVTCVRCASFTYVTGPRRIELAAIEGEQ